jgi:hypothetical protein
MPQPADFGGFLWPSFTSVAPTIAWSANSRQWIRCRVIAKSGGLENLFLHRWMCYSKDRSLETGDFFVQKVLAIFSLGLIYHSMAFISTTISWHCPFKWIYYVKNFVLHFLAPQPSFLLTIPPTTMSTTLMFIHHQLAPGKIIFSFIKRVSPMTKWLGLGGWMRAREKCQFFGVRRVVPCTASKLPFDWYLAEFTKICLKICRHIWEGRYIRHVV